MCSFITVGLGKLLLFSICFLKVSHITYCHLGKTTPSTQRHIHPILMVPSVCCPLLLSTFLSVSIDICKGFQHFCILSFVFFFMVLLYYYLFVYLFFVVVHLNRFLFTYGCSCSVTHHHHRWYLVICQCFWMMAMMMMTTTQMMGEL